MNSETYFAPGYLINRAARLFQKRREGQYQKLGLAVAQTPVLMALKEGGSLPQKELARMMQVEQPTMAQLLARMERDGLIRRAPDPGDKRISLISLTPLALEKTPQVQALLIEGNADALRGFTEQEVATLSRLLRRVVNNLDPAGSEERNAEREQEPR